MEKIVLDRDVYLVKNFLSNEECDRFIHQSEGIGYEEATVTTWIQKTLQVVVSLHS